MFSLNNFSSGVHIGDTLKQLAERRSDIFGVSAEETLIGRKLGEEEEQALKKTPKEVWDGHTASIERATKLAHSNITYEDQIKAIHKAKGLLYVYRFSLVKKFFVVWFIWRF